MTTASRPTFAPAQGGTGKGETDLSTLSKQYSSRDLPGHTKLKYRQDGQGSVDELKGRNFRKELDEREKVAKEKRTSGASAVSDRDRDATSSAAKKSRLEPITAANLDADDPVDDEEEEEAAESDDDDDDSELLAELARIRKERAQELAQKEVERKAEEERIRTENILRGNPLINAEKGEFKVTKRWDDDVVFKNCARGEEDKKKSEFVNDTLRSEFHRKFMTKYIK